MSVTEYAMKNSSHILYQLMNELKYLDGIVAYSIFQMPYEDSKRKKFFSTIVKKKKTIYFATERLKISNKDEMNRIEKIWLVRKALNKCAKIEDYKNVKKFCN